MGKDNLPEYREHIARFLSAFTAGDETSLRMLRGETPAVLPQPHIGQVYDSAAFGAIKARQNGMTRGENRPHCIIAKDTISVRQCVATQNARDCCGCAAVTRFCAECGYDAIAFPMSELCSLCLTKALRNPKLDELQNAWVVHVSCPLSGNSQITASTCRRMQSEACGKCNAITRVCLNCKERRVRYPEFGLCLRCHVETWSLGWEPMSDENLVEAEAERTTFFSREQAQAQAAETVLTPNDDEEMGAVDDESGVEEIRLPEDQGVALIHAISRVWQAIRELYPDVPAVVVLPQPVGTDRASGVVPDTTGVRWRPRGQVNTSFHEILVSMDFLDQPPVVIMAQLLHAAVHAMNYMRKIKDHSKSSRYHNTRFRDLAQTLGLEVRQVANYGYAETVLMPETAVEYAEVIDGLRLVMKQYQSVGTEAGEKEREEFGAKRRWKKKKGDGQGTATRSRKAVCSCGFIIRVSLKTLESTEITCGTCGQRFKLV